MVSFALLNYVLRLASLLCRISLLVTLLLKEFFQEKVKSINLMMKLSTNGNVTTSQNVRKRPKTKKKRESFLECVQI